jgi:3-phenylpropionate/trans-cinnamate dioxygenase ferredoxin subunit
MYEYTHINPANCEFYEIASIEDLPAGERLIVQIDDQEVLVFNIAGEIFAIGNVCSHDGNPLDDGEIEDHEITCVRHGARFDIRTGKVRSMPAIVDIPAYPVRIVDGKIEVGLPKGGEEVNLYFLPNA